VIIKLHFECPFNFLIYLICIDTQYENSHFKNSKRKTRKQCKKIIWCHSSAPLLWKMLYEQLLYPYHVPWMQHVESNELFKQYFRRSIYFIYYYVLCVLLYLLRIFKFIKCYNYISNEILTYTWNKISKIYTSINIYVCTCIQI
jgi:hypothetical protein